MIPLHFYAPMRRHRNGRHSSGDSAAGGGDRRRPGRHFAAQAGALVFHAENVSFSNVGISAVAGPLLQTYNTEVSGLDAVPPATSTIKYK